ncbi:MAG: hypothetical protein U1E97_12695 [Alphaproteobacteria bacterium]
MKRSTSAPALLAPFLLSLVLLSPVLLSLAACSSSGTVIGYASYENYGISHFSYAAAGRDFQVRVMGTPFASTDPSALADAVVAAMQGANFGPQTHFVTRPTPSTRDNFHAALLFNPTPLTTADAACAGQGASTTPADGKVRLLAAFCNRTRPLSFLESSASASGVADPGFRDLIRQSTMHLFPISDPFNNRGECQGVDC